MARVDDKTLQQVAEQAELTPSYLTFMAMAASWRQLRCWRIPFPS
jgi:hypothetical protein